MISNGRVLVPWNPNEGFQYQLRRLAGKTSEQTENEQITLKLTLEVKDHSKNIPLELLIVNPY